MAGLSPGQGNLLACKKPFQQLQLGLKLKNVACLVPPLLDAAAAASPCLISEWLISLYPVRVCLL